LSLREALSVFVTRRVDRLRVVDDPQRTLGVLHVADLLKAPA
jgi:osmoprotectant transport system ATP-binding protein